MSIKLRISITKEVLQATKDCKANNIGKNCAISYAVREIWSNARACDIYICPFYYPSRNISHKIYHNHGSFIDRFDSATPAERAAMQPFSFDIEVPDEVIGEVNIEEIRRICEGSKTLEVVK